MKLYQIGADNAYIEIDINSPEGIVIMNTLFTNSDIRDRGYVVNRRSKDGAEVEFVLIFDEAYTIDEVLKEYYDDSRLDKQKDAQIYLMDSVSEFTKWFIKAYPGCKCTITIDDRRTDIYIDEKPKEDTNEA